VLDCELFHALAGADRATYVRRPAGRSTVGRAHFMLCYSDGQPDAPHQVSREEILATFTDGWLAALTRTGSDTRC
jgi:hypothetical protein